MPAAITLIGTLWQARSARRIPHPPTQAINHLGCISSLTRTGPRWPILPRFAKQMILWHVLIALGLAAVWPEAGAGNQPWLGVLAALYVLGAIFYAIALALARTSSDDSTTIEAELKTDPQAFATALLNALSNVGLEVTEFRRGSSSSEVAAGEPALVLHVSARVREETHSNQSGAHIDMLVNIVATPRRGIDGAWRARRIADWFARELVRAQVSEETMNAPG